MTQTQIEKKVEDYLRNSHALEDYWQRPLTPEQLQAEMDRMSQHTKQPEVLRELFAALGNDPFIVAECLARPALAERLVTSWYAYDERFHGEAKRRAEAELQAHPTVEQIKSIGVTYSEIEFVKSEAESHTHRTAVRLDRREWDAMVQRVAQIQIGAFTPFQENESAYYATAVIEKSANRLKLATVAWQKETFQWWRDKLEDVAAVSLVMPVQDYTLPALPWLPNACVDDTWTATATGPSGRASHTAIWTGSEMIIWGGYDGTYLRSGAKYNPILDSWTKTSTLNAPSVRTSHRAVWAGNEMIVWGGQYFDGSNFVYLNTGARYNPGTDTWTATSTTNAPSARSDHVAVWTGGEMIVWGGVDNSSYLNTGGNYDPATDSWAATTLINAPPGRVSHTGIWTGTE